MALLHVINQVVRRTKTRIRCAAKVARMDDNCAKSSDSLVTATGVVWNITRQKCDEMGVGCLERCVVLCW